MHALPPPAAWRAARPSLCDTLDVLAKVRGAQLKEERARIPAPTPTLAPPPAAAAAGVAIEMMQDGAACAQPDTPYGIASLWMEKNTKRKK